MSSLAFLPAFAVRKERLIGYFGMLLGALSLSAAVVGFIAVLEQNFLWVLPAHCVAAITGAYAGSIADKRRLGKQFFPWVMALTVPLFGGVAAYFLLETMKKPKVGTLLEEYAVYLNDAAAYRDSVPVLEREMPETAELVSLADVLTNPSSEAEQRIAVEHLADMETQAAIEILRKVMASSNKEGFFFAMTAMTQMEDKMLTYLQELEASITLIGEEQVEAEILLKTAVTYIDFMYYQFAVGERRAEYLQRVETILQCVLSNAASNANQLNEVLILLGRVKLQVKDGEAAAKCFNRYIERNPERPLGYLWRAEAWYILGKYGRVREDCHKVKQMKAVPPNMLGSMEYWLPEAPTTEESAVV